MEVVLTLAGLIVAAVVVVLLAIRSLIVICPPNRISVISGRSRQDGEGTARGYRIIRGGRTIRIPLLEKVDWMDLNTIAIELSVTNAYSKGSIPLNVQAVGDVKISSREGVLDNAIERFLGRPIGYVQQIAKETLEANLRGVLATLTPEEVNEDRLKFASVLIEEADDDMRILGLDLDVLKIQNVTDEAGYLDSVGRRRTAQVIKEARVAEAERQAEAQESEADSRRRAEVARADADLLIVERENALRVRTAELEADALIKEEQAKVAGDKARAIAQQELQHERIELERRRLEADIVAPARAEKEAKELIAKGVAASIIEDGAAQIDVFRRLVEQYQLAGEDAQQIFVLNMLPDLVDRIVGTVEGVSIDRVSIIDSGSGEPGIPAVMSQLPAAVIKLTEQIENATGVNILSNLGGPRRAGSSASTPAAATDDAGGTGEPVA
ncbi:MAG: SPFH domain-containing protein [Acidimicrobiia bacterium]|nr:SPFH domain-containing protein [Acidimicrobiia bacterium]